MVVHYSLWGWIVFVGISTEIKVSTPSRVVRVSDIDEERGAYELCSNCKFLNVARTKISNPNYIKLHFCVSLHILAIGLCSSLIILPLLILKLAYQYSALSGINSLCSCYYHIAGNFDFTNFV